MKLNKIYQERKHVDKAAAERDDSNRLIRKNKSQCNFK